MGKHSGVLAMQGRQVLVLVRGGSPREVLLKVVDEGGTLSQCHQRDLGAKP